MAKIQNTQTEPDTDIQEIELPAEPKIDLHADMAELVTLQTETSKHDMRKAELLARIKSTGAFKPEFPDWKSFCAKIGYDRNYTYAIIRAFSNPTVKDAYYEIGALNAQTIAKADKVLTRADVEELVEFARVNSSGAVKRQVKERKDLREAEAKAAEDAENPKSELELALEHKSELQDKIKFHREERAYHLEEMRKAQAELDTLEETILSLSK